jgi:hypothetical protein
MSSNITSTLGGRGLGGVAQRYAVDPLALRGELGSSTVPHRKINGGVASDAITIANDFGNPMQDRVNQTDTAFEVTLPATTTMGAPQLLTLNTRYPAAWGIGPTTHTLEVELFGLGVDGDPTVESVNATAGNSLGFVQAAFEIVGMGNNDINIVVKRTLPAPNTNTHTLIGAIVLIRLKKRTKVVAT